MIMRLVYADRFRLNEVSTYDEELMKRRVHSIVDDGDNVGKTNATVHRCCVLTLKEKNINTILPQ